MRHQQSEDEPTVGKLGFRMDSDNRQLVVNIQVDQLMVEMVME